MKNFHRVFDYEEGQAVVTIYNWPKTYLQVTWYCDRIKATRDARILFDGFTGREFMDQYIIYVKALTNEILAEIIDSVVLQTNDQDYELDANTFFVNMKTSKNSPNFIEEIETGTLVEKDSY